MPDEIPSDQPRPADKEGKIESKTVLKSLVELLPSCRNGRDLPVVKGVGSLGVGGGGGLGAPTRSTHAPRSL